MVQMRNMFLVGLLGLVTVVSAQMATTTTAAAPKEKKSAFTYEVALVNKQGHVGLVNTTSAKTLGFGRLAASVWGTYTTAEDYFVSINGTDAKSVIVPEDGKYFKKTALNLSIAYGVTRFMDIAMSIPMYYDWVANTNGALPNSSQLHKFGDLEMSVKFQYPPYAHRRFFDLALYGALRFKTGDKNDGVIPFKNYYRLKSSNYLQNSYTSEGTEIDMKLLFTWDFAEVAEHFPVKFHINAGINWATNAEILNTMPFSAGLEIRPAGWLALYADFYAEPTFADIEKQKSDISGFTGNPGDTAVEQGLKHSPLRMTPGIQLMTPFGLYANAGVALSLSNTSGYFYTTENADGSSRTLIETAVEPKVSLVASVGWNGFVLKRDRDKDGIPDGDDNCPDEAEDFDGFMDGDGCPDLDNDGDGLTDDLDKCPNDPEDLDGFEDEDGCPEYDNDGDGVVDSLDQCPNKAEDLDGFEDEDGCPEYDNDGDGIVDSLDQCPNSAEDFDGYNDEDGCPELDNDMDGIVDSLDQCPNNAEVYNLFEDEDGCPDEVPAPVVIVQEDNTPAPAPAPVQAKEIAREDVVLRGLSFQSGKAVLKPESYILLDDVTASLRDWPEVKLEIRGHTDSIGSEGSNRRLSLNRAKAVKEYIVSQGISEDRIRAIGLGESQPVADNATAEGRSMNRRVEMRRID